MHAFPLTFLCRLKVRQSPPGLADNGYVLVNENRALSGSVDGTEEREKANKES